MATQILQHPETGLVARLKLARWGLLLAALGFVPLLYNFFVLSWKRPAYQFFPMALFAAGLLAARAARESGARLQAGRPEVTRIVGGATLVLWLAGNLLWSPWLGFMAFLMGMTTVLWYFGGQRVLKAFLPTGLVLLAIVPPPLGLDERLTVWLRTVATDYSCQFLDWLRVTYNQDVNSIELPSRTLFMEEACSGINSFVLCNTFCLFWLLWKRRPLWWLWLALPATSLFVVLGNVIRITSCAATDYFYGWDLLTGWKHETFGLVLLLCYCGLVLSLDQLMLFFLQPARPAPVKPELAALPVARQPVPDQLPDRSLVSFRLAASLAAILGLLAFGIHFYRGGKHSISSILAVGSVPELKLSLPRTLAGWERVTSNSGDQSLIQTLGVHSISWHFVSAGIEAVVAVDYPLDGFHDVRECYRNNGWQTFDESELHDPQTQANQHVHRLALNKAHRHAIVLHSIMDEQGNWLEPNATLTTRFANSPPPTGYRIQLITGGDAAGYAPISDAGEVAVRQLYISLRAELASQMLEQFHNQNSK